MNKFYRLGLMSLTRVVALSVLLSSCGGGGAAITGAGQVAGAIDAFQDIQDVGDIPIGPLCSGNISGDWQGKTSNGGVILLTLRQNNACEIQGEAAFPPCLMISPVKGMVLLFAQSFTVETIDGSLFVERIENIDIDNSGITETGNYRFNNTRKVADCPPSETGSVKFTKIS